MRSTPYHASYYAHSLTLRHPSDDIQKLTAALGDARVDLNPHQVEAALFAFKSPLKKGAILADEVGLGKTIEAGLVIAQKWAEKERRILIICPANLRKQWAMELEEKFFLQSAILENTDFKNAKTANPFRRQDKVTICSYQLAHKREKELLMAGWGLAVLDEAHRLRNVYRPDNKIGNSIKRSLKDVRKILLTATPLQNSLSELYGLVSLIDDYAFGDYNSYKSQYSRLDSDTSFNSLKARLAPICQRTLRRDVQQYIKYTERKAIVEEFVPHKEEMELYHLVSEYLRRPRLYALPNSQRHLMTLILRKLLASSSFAIQGTFEKLADKLEAELKGIPIDTDITADFDTFNELAEQWEQDEDNKYDSSDREAIEDEIKELREYTRLALSIKSNSKGEKLVKALEKGFSKLNELGAPKKAIIFTESRRTQDYLKQILESSGYKGKIVLFNGTNNDHDSRQIYNHWLAVNKNSDRVSGSKTADMRQALTDYFRNEAEIMIATEAAAEGINLQFCSLVVNYDLPWNPQRIEQRIGRCHRYGQKFDVVVLNFLNKTNEADQRVYKLLDDKFQLFNGVFGASDEILGAIEEGVDFEKRIGDIFQRCRTTEEINSAFDQLQAEFEQEIDKTMKSTRRKLLENFDAEVHEKLRMDLKKGREYLTKQEKWLWAITKDYIGLHGVFNDDRFDFRVKNNVFGLPAGYYRLLRHGQPEPQPEERTYKAAKLNPRFTPTEHYDGFRHIYRTGHPLAQKIIEHYKSTPLEVRELVFNHSADRIKRTAIEPLKDKIGYMQLTKLTIASIETTEYLVLSGITADGLPIDQETCHRLFDLPATVGDCVPIHPKTVNDLKVATQLLKKKIVDRTVERNEQFFVEESEKLDNWGEDQRNSLRVQLKDLDTQINELKKQARAAANLPERLKFEKERKKLDTERDTAWREYDSAAKEIERQKDALIDEIEKRLSQQITEEVVFTIRWRIK